MNTKPYAVVFFTTENMYSEIPTSWLLNEKECYWPKSVNAVKLMQKCVEPDTEGWEIHQIRIVGYSATLEGARKKAGDSEYSTSNECWQDTGRGRRRKIPTARTSQDNNFSSSDEETITPPPTPKTIHKNVLADPQKNIDSNSINSEDNAEAVMTGCESGSIEKQPTDEWDEIEDLTRKIIITGGNADGNETPIPSPLPEENSQTEGQINDSEDVATGTTTITLETLYEEIVKLRTICKSNRKFLISINTKINSLEFGHLPNSNSNQNDTLKNVPLKTHDEVLELELQLEDVNKRNSLARLFRCVGGRDGKDHLYRCLAQLFTNELATQYSWFGQRDNFKANNLKSVKILTDSIISWHSSLSFSSIEKYAGEWFRLSRQRLNREIKKKDAESQ